MGGLEGNRYILPGWFVEILYVASKLYLDWISDPEHIHYLQTGDEGVTHTVTADGAIATQPATGDAIMNSGEISYMTKLLFP